MKLNLKNVFLSVGMFVFAFAMFGLVSVNKAEAVFTCTAKASTAWNVGTTWNACGAGGPVLGDTVNIPVGFVVNITGADAAATILHLVGGGGLTLSGSALSVAGLTTIDNSSTMATNGGTYTTGSLLVSGILDIGTGPSTVSTTTTISNGGIIEISGASGAKTFTGTLTIDVGGTYNEMVANTTGITFSGAVSGISIQNAGTATLNSGLHTISNLINNVLGTFNYAEGVTLTTLSASTSGTVNYNGGDQAVQPGIAYYNLGISGSGIKTVPALTGVNAIIHDFAITSPAKVALGGDSNANSLTIGGVSMDAGTWGSSASSPIAANVYDAYFDTSGTYKLTVATTSATIISATAITGIVAPVTNITPVTTSISGTGYTGTVAWSPNPTKFAVSTVYTATITLAATPGYTLTGVTANQFTVSGAVATNSINSGVITAVFPATFPSGGGGLTSGGGTVYIPPIVIKAPPVTLTITSMAPTAITISGCSGTTGFSTVTGLSCSGNTAMVIVTTPVVIAGCDGRTTGFSTTGAGSCTGNLVSVTTSTSYNLGTVTLKNGSKGESVKQLQKLLNKLLKMSLKEDGILGPKTIEVIKKWQKDHGLVVDGLVGAKTKAAMKLEAEK